MGTTRLTENSGTARWWQADEPRQRLALMVLVALVAVLVLHAAYYWPFLSDDALISLRYAKRWVGGQGLTWTDGERVEGYTNFLWVVLAAGAGRLGFDYIGAVRVLGIAGVILSLVVVGRSAGGREFSLVRLVAAGSLLVGTAPMAVWAIGGLEQCLVGGVLALSLHRLASEVRVSEPWYERHSAWGLAALSLLRADSVVLVGAALAGAACVPRPSLSSLRRAASTGIPSAIALLAQLAFRRMYYGDWQPNTAFVKLALTPERFASGLSYVARGYASAAVLVVLAIFSTVIARTRDQSRLRVVWAVLLVWTFYVAVVGGDIFPAWRQLVPSLVLLCMLIAEGAEAARPWIDKRPWGVVFAFLFLLGTHVFVQFGNADNRHAKAERWEWDGLSMGKTLKQAFGKKQPLHAVDAAGALPYWSELPSLDMLGLNDRHIARTRPEGFGTGWMGHELGDGAYVLGRAPDLISFNWPAGTREPELLSGRQMLRMPEFHANYQWIRVRGAFGNRIVGEIWVRRENGKLGVRRSSERVDVPAYFLTGQESEAVAELDDSSSLVALVSDAFPGVLPPLAVPPGIWRFDWQPPTLDLVVDVRCGKVSMSRVGAVNGLTVIRIERASSVGIAVASPAGIASASLSMIRFTRERSAEPTFACLNSADPLRILAAELSSKKPKTWAHPRSRLFAENGLVVELGARQKVAELELSLRGGKSYALELMRNDQTVWAETLRRKSNPETLVEHRIELDPELPHGTFRLFIKPRGGAGISSVGHLIVE